MIAVGSMVLLACGSSSSTLRADAGPDVQVTIGDSPSFDACASEGEIADYRWTIINAPADMAEDEGKLIRESMTSCSYTLEASMQFEEMGSWEIELTVTDVDGNTSTDAVTVTVLE